MNNELFLSSEEIIEDFINYIEDPIYNYAYMIDGSWGSGKTYFVKKELIPAIEKNEEKKKKDNAEYQEKRVLYVSLYGIKETEEISRLLFLELHRIKLETLSSTKIGKVFQKHKTKITTYVGSGAKLISDVAKNFTGADFEGLFNNISTGYSLDNCIFIFDDLERTSCNINDILGYINNFVEHDGIKVLLVVNEKEINTVSQLDINPTELLVCLQNNLDFAFIERGDNKKVNNSQKISLDNLMKRVNILFARNQAYKQIKEKVVGITVKYQPSYLCMIKSLAEKHLKKNDILKNIVLNKSEKICEIAMYYEHLNLRTFLFFLSKISTIYECLHEYPQSVEKLIEYTFLVSVKFKSGLNMEEWKETSLFMKKSIYGDLDFRNYCIAFKFIDNFILYGKFNSKEIIEIVELYEELEKRNAENINDPSKKLQNWITLDEVTTKELMDEVLVKMKTNDYSFDSYLHILNSFTTLVSIGFDEKYLSKLMDYMKNNIRNTDEKVELRRWSSTFYSDEDRKLYKIKVEEINKVVMEKENKYREKELEDLISDVNSWGKKIGEYVSSHKNIVDNSFIYKLDASKILELIDESNTENIEEFRYAIGDFYSFSNISDYYMDDYPNLKKIYDELDIQKSTYDLIKKKTVELLRDLIGRKLDLLKPNVIDLDEDEHKMNE